MADQKKAKLVTEDAVSTQQFVSVTDIKDGVVMLRNKVPPGPGSTIHVRHATISPCLISVGRGLAGSCDGIACWLMAAR